VEVIGLGWGFLYLLVSKYIPGYSSQRRDSVLSDPTQKSANLWWGKEDMEVTWFKRPELETFRRAGSKHMAACSFSRCSSVLSNTSQQVYLPVLGRKLWKSSAGLGHRPSDLPSSQHMQPKYYASHRLIVLFLHNAHMWISSL
jgi:hypothetical protein